jgi:hypothetical protein
MTIVKQEGVLTTVETSVRFFFFETSVREADKSQWAKLVTRLVSASGK